MEPNGTEVVISTPLRTAIGTFGGMLKDTSASDLGVVVASEILARTHLQGSEVDSVIIGHVLSANQGPNAARQVGIKAGLPVEVPAMVVNRLCGSGLQAVVSAAQEIKLGDAEVCLAGGIENMDQAPFLLPKARFGYRMGMPGAEILDSMLSDGLWDVFNNYHMGNTAENVAQKYGITRQEQDEFALRSHERATAAIEAGYFKDQIVPVEIRQRKGAVQFDRDEHVRADTSLESLAHLKPAFSKDGTVTAGNSSGINDGAALMLVASRAQAEELGLPIDARLVSYAVAGVDPAYMGLGPIPAICRALEKADLTLDDIDVFEVNEAFASIALVIGKELRIPDEKLNPLGGAVALGHPIGASGGVLTAKLVYELQRRQARYGIAALCIGGGMGIAAVLERV
jgi:acetyl-CoA C-acetyltransferase